MSMMLRGLATRGIRPRIPAAASTDSATYIDSYTGVNSATIGPHQVGDVFVAWASRDGSSTAPAIPDDWTPIHSLGSNALGTALAWKVADTTGEVSGTFTNASSLIIDHWRPQAGYSASIGAINHNSYSNNTTLAFPTITFQNQDGTSFFLGYLAHRSTDISITAFPPGAVISKHVQDAIDTAMSFRSAAPVSAWAGQNVAFGGTLASARTVSLELKFTSGVPVNVPTGLAANVSGSTITLSWTDTNSGAAQTIVETSLNGTTGWSQVTTKSTGVTEHIITNASAGTTYYRVRALIGGTASANTSPVSATVSQTVNAPTSPGASASGSTITVSWTDTNSGTAQTSIERSANGTTGWAQIAVTAAGVTSYANSGLGAGTYYYRVRALIGATYSTYTTIVNATATGGAISLPEPDLVRDDFNTSDLTAAGTSAAINYLNRFTWGGTYRTFIGTQQNGVATKIRPGLVRTWPSKDFTGLVAANSACFAFQYPDWPLAEQRFDLGANYSEVWLRYWMQVPANFSHGNANNKWLAVWTVDYDGAGDVTFQTRPTSGGSCRLVVQDGGVAVPEVDCYTNFIVVPTDRGRWMQMVYRFIPATSGANGVIQVWRRWNGEDSWTLLYSKTNATFSEGGVGVHQGYILGSAEGGPYTDPAETIFLMQRFEASRVSLI